MTVADWLASWLASKGVRHAFGIIGAGNIAIFDAIARLGKTEIICTHHEQAAAMSATYYWRTCGRLAPVLATTGAGSSNTLTGVLAAWMDSIPLLVISGNEPKKFMVRDKENRVIGVQGYQSAKTVEGITKFAVSAHGPMEATEWLRVAYETALLPRLGPCWLDLPRDIQTMKAPT